MGLVNRLLPANPGIQVSTLLSGSLSTPSAKGAFVESGYYESIATSTLASSNSTISFASIPSTFKHLELRMFFSGTSTSDVYPYVRFNSDSSTSNYTRNVVYSTETTTGGNGTGFGTYPGFTAGYLSKDVTTYPSLVIVFVNEYLNTNKKKIAQSIYMNESNSSGLVGKGSTQWNQYTAISSIDVVASTGTFSAGSSVALYGIRGATI
jgi:hypothetical protein